MKKNNETEYIARIDHLSEKCRYCDEKLDLVVKDLKPELNVTVLHTKCYITWMQNIKEYGRRQGLRESKKVVDE